MMFKFRTSISSLLPSTRSGKFAVIILAVWLIFALLSPFIANHKPIIAKNTEGWSIPIFGNESDQKLIGNTYSFSILTPIKYRYDDLNPSYALLPPMSDGKKGIHLLGTDKLGRDIAAGMINGARVAFIISFSTIFLSLLIGLTVGLIIGYYGDRGIQKNVLQQFILLIVLVVIAYYLVHLLRDGMNIYSLLPLLLSLVLGILFDNLLKRLPIKKYGLPLDLFTQRIFEINNSIPGIFIILALIAIFVSPSIMTLAYIMAFLYWMTIARHIRAETLQIREENYILSARATGISDIRLMLGHILPNALPPILVIVAFSFSGVILLESTLSFLGIGIPVEEISWGKLLSEARRTPKAWWLAVFPGIAIFLILYSFNTLGDWLSSYQRKNEQ